MTYRRALEILEAYPRPGLLWGMYSRGEDHCALGVLLPSLRLYGAERFERAVANMWPSQRGVVYQQLEELGMDGGEAARLQFVNDHRGNMLATEPCPYRKRDVIAWLRDQVAREGT